MRTGELNQDRVVSLRTVDGLVDMFSCFWGSMNHPPSPQQEVLGTARRCFSLNVTTASIGRGSLCRRHHGSAIVACRVKVTHDTYMAVCQILPIHERSKRVVTPCTCVLCTLFVQVTDFAAMNDELEADDSSTFSSSPEDDHTGDDDNADDEPASLKPRVGQIEKELTALKLRLEEGIAGMAALRREMLSLVSNRPRSSSGNGGDDARGGSGYREPKRYSGAAGIRKRAPDTFTTSPRPLGDESGQETDSDEDRQADASNTPPMSPKSSISYTPPLSPALGAVHAPPRSPASGVSSALTARGANASDASDTRSRGAAKSTGSNYNSEGNESNREESEADDRSLHSSRAGFTFATALEERDAAVRSLEESDGEESDATEDRVESRRSEAASDAGSAVSSDDDGGGDSDEGSALQAEEEEEEEEEPDEEEEEEEREEEEEEEEEWKSK